MVLERLTMTEVDLRGFKLILQELHYDSILTTSANAIMFLLWSHHMSAVNIIKRSGPKTLPWGMLERIVVNAL